MRIARWVGELMRQQKRTPLGRWQLTTSVHANKRGSRADDDHSLDWRPAVQKGKPDADFDAFYLMILLHSERS